MSKQVDLIQKRGKIYKIVTKVFKQEQESRVHDRFGVREQSLQNSKNLWLGLKVFELGTQNILTTPEIQFYMVKDLPIVTFTLITRKNHIYKKSIHLSVEEQVITKTLNSFLDLFRKELANC